MVEEVSLRGNCCADHFDIDTKGESDLPGISL